MGKQLRRQVRREARWHSSGTQAPDRTGRPWIRVDRQKWHGSIIYRALLCQNIVTEYVGGQAVAVTTTLIRNPYKAVFAGYGFETKEAALEGGLASTAYQEAIADWLSKKIGSSGTPAANNHKLAANNHKLIEADYSELEIRIAGQAAKRTYLLDMETCPHAPGRGLKTTRL